MADEKEEEDHWEPDKHTDKAKTFNMNIGQINFGGNMVTDINYNGLGGFDAVLHGLDPDGLRAQEGRFGALVLARSLRQQSHLTHLRPMRVRGVLPGRCRRTPRISYPEVNNLIHG